MGWAIFLGGCAQLIAGLIDLRKNNAFGGTAFIAYGLFWLAMAFGWGEKRPSLFLFSVCCIMISSIKKIAYNIIIAIIQRMCK